MSPRPRNSRAISTAWRCDTVEHSMASVPGFMLPAAPSCPSHTDREASSSATMVTTTSAPTAASFGEAAHVGLYLASGENGIVSAFAVIFILTLVNAFIRPVVNFFFAGLNCLTLGLFSFVINALMLGLVGWLVDGFEVRNLLSGIGLAVIIAIAASHDLRTVNEVPMPLTPGDQFWANIVEAWTRADLGPKIVNSVLFAGGVALGKVFIAALTAWICESMVAVAFKPSCNSR